MKNIKHLCLLIVLSSLFSCNDNIFSNCKEDYTFHTDYFLHFLILDKKTGENLLEIGVNRYYRDTVQIFSEDLEPLRVHPDNSGSLVFNFLYDVRAQDEPLNTPIEHTYYLYFEEEDYDTLSMRYEIGLDKCDDKILTQWSVSYNDSLYFDYPSGPPNSRTVNFLKPTTK